MKLYVLPFHNHSNPTDGIICSIVQLAVTGMDLLSQRIDAISPRARLTLSGPLVLVITHLSAVISNSSALLSLGAIKTLGAVAVGASTEEAGALTRSVPSVLGAGVRFPALGLDVLQTLNAYT